MSPFLCMQSAAGFRIRRKGVSKAAAEKGISRKKEVLQYADYSLTISEEAVKNYICTFSIPKEKIVSITNGYDETDFVPLKIPPIIPFFLPAGGCIRCNTESDRHDKTCCRRIKHLLCHIVHLQNRIYHF